MTTTRYIPTINGFGAPPSAYSSAQRWSLLLRHLFILPPPHPALYLCDDLLMFFARFRSNALHLGLYRGLLWDQSVSSLVEHFRSGATSPNSNLDVSALTENYSSEGLIPPPVLAICQILPVMRPQRCLEKDIEAPQASCPINTVFSFLVCDINRSVEPWNRKPESSARAVIHSPLLKVIFRANF